MQKFSKGGNFLGYSVYTVASSSMVPNYDIGDTLLVKKIPIKEIRVGDVVTYIGEASSVKDMIITHRVEKIEQGESGTLFHTKGIANNIEDPIVNEKQILGKVIYKFKILSIIGELSFNMYKLFFFITVPLAFLIAVEIIKLLREKEE